MRTSLLHQEGTNAVKGGIKCPNIWSPIAVDESPLEGEEARKELLEIGDDVALENRKEREEEG